MTIWDDLKAAWSLNGTPLTPRKGVNVIDRKSFLAPNALLVDGPDRVDFTPAETSPLYIFSTQAAPWSAVADDLWLAPWGQLQATTAIFTPIAIRQTLSDMTFHIVSSAVTDSVQIDVCKNGSNPSGLTLTVPANTNSSTFLSSVTFPVTFEIGDTLALRLRQNGTAAQAAWNAYILLG